ncbi:MAG: Mpo1-like protein [Burkholderiales bacterium]
MQGFLDALAVQRWDDHRYYHHSRVNQALHLVSALTFLASYVLLFTNPVAAAMLGWLVAMVTRQIGHFFFEPKSYDAVNDASHDHKEAIKVGYNLRRKVVLLAIWAASPLLLIADPTMLGLLDRPSGVDGYVRNVAYLWLFLGFAALAFRAAQLAVTKDLQTALVWVTKIATDPFHDIKLYHRAPLHLLRGEFLDPGPVRKGA